MHVRPSARTTDAIARSTCARDRQRATAQRKNARTPQASEREGGRVPTRAESAREGEKRERERENTRLAKEAPAVERCNAATTPERGKGAQPTNPRFWERFWQRPRKTAIPGILCIGYLECCNSQGFCAPCTSNAVDPRIFTHYAIKML